MISMVGVKDMTNYSRINSLFTRFTTFFLLVFLFLISGCTPINNSQTIKPSSSNQYSNESPKSFDEVKGVAGCWLNDNQIDYGEKVGGGQCTDLARKLNNAPSYGSGNGGVDYLKSHSLPTLKDEINNVKTCDTLIITAPGFDKAGHTVVVFDKDIENDKVYYLDQNFNNEGVSFRSLNISDIGQSTYVLHSSCMKPVSESCTSLSLQSLDMSSSPTPHINPTNTPTITPTFDDSTIKLYQDGFYAKYKRTFLECQNIAPKADTIDIYPESNCAERIGKTWFSFKSTGIDSNGVLTFGYSSDSGFQIDPPYLQIDPKNKWLNNNECHLAFWVPSQNFIYNCEGYVSDLRDINGGLIKRDDAAYIFQKHQEIVINGRSINTMVFSSEAEETITDDKNVGFTLIEKITGYYDAKTGLLQKLDESSSVASCEGCVDDPVGKETFHMIFELSETSIR